MTAPERKTKPILFTGPMVRAILREIEQPGTGKTQTRRFPKEAVPQPPSADNVVHLPPRHERPYLDAYNKSEWWCWWTRDDRPCEQFNCGYAVGDLLWVRETCAALEAHDGIDCVRYAADQVWMPIENSATAADRWVDLHHYGKKRGADVPSIHMPRWASRLTLEVTGVKVERLQAITEADAIAEGVTKVRDHCHVIRGFDYDLAGLCHSSAVTPFAKLWDHLNGADAWEANPWVVAVTFVPHLVNVDAFLARSAVAA